MHFEYETVYINETEKINQGFYHYFIELLKCIQNPLLSSMNEMMMLYFESTQYRIIDPAIRNNIINHQKTIVHQLETRDYIELKNTMISLLQEFSKGKLATVNSAKHNMFHPIVTERVSILVYQQIKQLITSGALKPGEYLPSERELVEQFKRSRPTIREALKILESEFLITIKPGSKTIVNDIYKAYIDNSFQYILENQNINSRYFNQVNKIRCKAFSLLASERMTDDNKQELEVFFKQWKALPGNDVDTKYKEIFSLLDLIAKYSQNRIFLYVNQVFNYSNYHILLKSQTIDLNLMEEVLENYINALLQKNYGNMDHAIDMIYSHI